MMMTTDEAIQRFEKQLTDARVVLDSGFGTHEGECDMVYRHRKEMAEIALSALRRIAEDDKAREEGRFDIWPCGVGATIWVIDTEENDGGEETVWECSVIKRFGYKTERYFSAASRERKCWFSETEVSVDDLNTVWFLTRQAAEAALGGGEGD